MTQPSIAIIDTNVGNFWSVENAFKLLSCNAFVTQSKEVIRSAEIIVLPGTGSFPIAYKKLNGNGLLEEIKYQITVNQKPFLGICLGLQLLTRLSYEDGTTPGMSIVSGVVEPLPINRFNSPLHVGWSRVRSCKDDPLFLGIPRSSYFYFSHSHYLTQVEPSNISATLESDECFPACLRKANIVGVQFHPEKSQIQGSRFIRNFLSYARTYC